MFFSDAFNVSAEEIENYGAVDISLICDIPLFIDPMLIFGSEKEDYKKLHKQIIDYFYFLLETSAQPMSDELLKWYIFKEVYNNWFGFSLNGNRGKAYGETFADYLYKYISKAIIINNTNNHFEKVLLFSEGSGKDRISDLTVCLIKDYLLSYTENFAKNHIVSYGHKKEFLVEKAVFNFETNKFESKNYILPFIKNYKDEDEYVILTPKDILRKGEPSISNTNFTKGRDDILNALPNSVLKTTVSNHIQQAVSDRINRRKTKRKQDLSGKTIESVKRKAFKEIIEITKSNQELYDFYIELCENDIYRIQLESKFELNFQITRFINNTKKIIDYFKQQNYEIAKETSEGEDAKNRLHIIKDIIEKNAHLLYIDNSNIYYEDDLKRFFKIIWYGTKPEYGCNKNTIVEFKHANSRRLNKYLANTIFYNSTTSTNGKIVVVCCFNDLELEQAKNYIQSNGLNAKLNDSVYLFDCRI